MRVIVQGNLVQRSYETKDGQNRTVIELRVEEVGPSLRWARAQVSRNERSDQGRGGYQGGNRGGAPAGGSYGGSNAGYGAPAGGTVDDPWRASSQGDAAFGEPPF